MKYVMFEDDLSCFPYGLLPNVSDYKFVSGFGGQNVKKRIRELGDNGFVYVDVSPDNQRTLSAYSSAVKAAREYSNVKIMPIPCIEYFFTKVFLGYSEPEFRVILAFLDYRKVPHNRSCKREFSIDCYERYCKSVINNTKKCFEDRRFDTADCLCNPYMDKQCIPYALVDKQKEFIHSIPLLQDILCGMPSEILHDKFCTELQHAENLYYAVSQAYIDCGIITAMPKLPKQF